MSIRKRTWKTRKGVEKEAWVVDYAVRGKRHLKTFAKKKEADAFFATVGNEILLGTHVPDSKSATIEEAGRLWIKSSLNAGLEQSTIDSYLQQFDHHINPMIGGKLLTQFHAPSVRMFEDELRHRQKADGSGQVLSDAMVRKIMGSLGSLFADAQERGLVNRNPVRDLTRGRRKGKQRQADKRQKGKIKVGVDIPSREEIKAIADNVGSKWRPLILTAIFTGMRASELRGLQWADVDFEKKEIHVHQRADRYNKIGPPKSVSGDRTIPLPPMALNILREWKFRCPKSHGNLVFPTSAGKIEYLQNIIKRGLVPAQIAGGVTVQSSMVGSDGKPVLKAKYTGMHALRHFYASWCINPRSAGGLELPPKVVQERLGHSSIMMTMDTYGHLFPRGDDSKELAAAEASLLA